MEAVIKSGERRKYERITINFDVFSRNTSKLIGKTVNLSLGGMFIETDNILKLGTKVLL